MATRYWKFVAFVFIFVSLNHATAAVCPEDGTGDFKLCYVDSTAIEIALAWDPVPTATGYLVIRTLSKTLPSSTVIDDILAGTCTTQTPVATPTAVPSSDCCQVTANSCGDIDEIPGGDCPGTIIHSAVCNLDGHCEAVEVPTPEPTPEPQIACGCNSTAVYAVTSGATGFGDTGWPTNSNNRFLRRSDQSSDCNLDASQSYFYIVRADASSGPIGFSNWIGPVSGG